MIASIMRRPSSICSALNVRRRETCPARALVVGMQCGGSDAFSGVTANPARRLRQRPSGPRRRDRDVLGEYRSPRRHGAAYGACCECRRGERDDRRAAAGTTAISSAAASTAAPTRRRATRRAACRTSSKRRWARSSNRAARRLRAWSRPARRRATGPALCGDAGQRFHLRHAAARGRHDAACVHDRPRHAVRPRRGAGHQGRDPERIWRGAGTI